MRILVVTVVHHPGDARIHGRQIGALRDARHQVTFAAPFTATGFSDPDDCAIADLPRAEGLHRLRSLRAARGLVRRLAPEHDLVLLHDPELLLAAGAAGATPVVWDVHEDLGAALVDKPWLPRVARRVMGRAVRAVERAAERRMHLILAEDAYEERFEGSHPVVPNEPVVPATVPPPGRQRVVYVGRISVGRGSPELIELGARLPAALQLELFGWAEPECGPALRDAEAAGHLVWHGRTPNTEALSRIEGALAGLSLLHDLPNYRHSRPTKVVEYMSRGLPVITTPTPVAREIVEQHQCGVVVPFGDSEAVADALVMLQEDQDLRERMGRNGHRAALAHYDWRSTGATFVSLLEGWARPRT